MNICDLKNCTGCFACMNICPAGAISVLLDDSFKTVPQIDKDKCISCGLCQKICPEINPVKGHSPKLCFAAWTKDDRDRQECSSGGIAAGFLNTCSALAVWCLEPDTVKMPKSSIFALIAPKS